MFTAALFMVAKTWMQPKCSSADEWIKKICHAHTVEYYSALIKEGNLATFDNLDEPGGHYAKWNKPDTEGHNTIWYYLYEEYKIDS